MKTIVNYRKIAKSSAILIALIMSSSAVFSADKAPSPEATEAVILTVMPFKSSAEAVPLNLGDSFSETVTTKLITVKGLKVYERAQFDKIRSELNLQNTSDLMDKNSATKIGSVISMDYLIVGSVTLAGGNLKAQIRLVQVKDGQDILSKQYEGVYPKGIFTLQDTITLDLIAALKIKLSDLDKQKITKPVSKSIDSWYLYNKSLGGGTISERIILLEKAVAQDPSFVQAQHLLADLYIASKQPKQALSVYAKILANDPHDFRALYNSSLIDYDLGDFVNSKIMITACLTEKIGDPDVLYHLALLNEYSEQGQRMGAGVDPRLALNYYEKAIEAAPLHKESLFASSILYLIIADSSQDVNEQLTLLLKSAANLETYIRLSKENDNFDEAQSTLEQVKNIIAQLKDYLKKR